MQSIEQLRSQARFAVQSRDWATVHSCARSLIEADQGNPEGHFLSGLVHKAATKPRLAVVAFEKTLELDDGRYDAGIELAAQYVIAERRAEALLLLERYEHHLTNSPRYLDMAATTYTTLGKASQAWPLYEQACRLQPNITLRWIEENSPFVDSQDRTRYVDGLRKAGLQ